MSLREVVIPVRVLVDQSNGPLEVRFLLVDDQNQPLLGLMAPEATPICGSKAVSVAADPVATAYGSEVAAIRRMSPLGLFAPVGLSACRRLGGSRRSPHAGGRW